jgi:phytoene synthase
MRSMRIDCAPVRMASWSELDGYMDGSAAAVGRIMAPLLGAGGSADSFASLGQAFQLTNFIRDVREDWELDRVYLPGVSAEQIARRQPSDGFRRLLAVEVGRARELFREGASAGEVVAPRVRRGMSMARSVYLTVLDRTERLDFDVLRRRVSLPPWELAGAVAHGLRAAV